MSSLVLNYPQWIPKNAPCVNYKAVNKESVSTIVNQSAIDEGTHIEHYPNMIYSVRIIYVERNQICEE